MARPSPYHMQDQVRDRVRLIMHGNDRAAVASALWPLIAIVATVTLLNIMLAAPSP